MRMLGRGLLVLLLLVRAVAAAPETGDVRKARAYLREVKKHLLESFIDSNRVKEEDLVVAGIKAMARASGSAPVRDAVLAEASLEDAVAAADRAAENVDLIALADAACRAMVAEIGDPYSHLFTDEEMAKLSGMLQGQGRDESAGLMFQNKDGRVVVGYVLYGYPAYQEGVEIGDEVLEIRGKPVATVKPEDYNDLLRLPAGDSLELRLRRDAREYLFKIHARSTAVKDVRFEYLGDGVGYLRLTIFDLNLVSEVKTALRDLKKSGMKGLILDLRHNPGGALPAATGVADLFLDQGLVIAHTVSHYKPSVGGFRLPMPGLDQDFTTKVRSEYEQMPMVCLVNRASASASELLAGALKDHKRAALVGETTYGKGVGQTAILLSSMLMKRYLYLTVMRYTTPHQHEVDHKGVPPDIACDEGRPSPELFASLWAFRQTGAAEKYRDAHWKEGLRQKAHHDDFETQGYPDFQDFYSGLGTKLTADQVREEIRRSARRRMEDEGKVWMTDLQTDKILQRGLVEILDRLGK